MQLNLTLGVTELDRTDWFYREILLLSPEPCMTAAGADLQCLILTCEGIRVVFQPLGQMEERHPALLQHLERTPLGSGVQLEFSCKNLTEIERLIKYHGWPIAYELDDREHRRRELWLQDPDGYLLVLNED